jgi:hypothetical protein
LIDGLRVNSGIHTRYDPPFHDDVGAFVERRLDDGSQFWISQQWVGRAELRVNLSLCARQWLRQVPFLRHLALQLAFCFEMRALSDRLVSSAPE